MTRDTATFGAGCFWGPEVTFGKVPGVIRTEAGYMGGTSNDPIYREVCAGNSGHVEVVQVTFDPEQVSYKHLLDVFWNCHDPTQVNRQGPDVGLQYRSVIFCHSAAQKAEAEATKKALDEGGSLERPVVTTVEDAPTFWRAEDYHQKYLEKRGLAFCHV